VKQFNHNMVLFPTTETYVWAHIVRRCSTTIRENVVTTQQETVVAIVGSTRRQVGETIDESA